MPASRSFLPAVALAGLALASSPVQAQSSKEAAKADIKTWGEAIGTAFTPGYWEGSMQELDGTGTVVNTDDRPDCIKAGEASKLGTSLSDMFVMIVDIADCTTTSGGKGSLNLKLECNASGGKHMAITSEGTYGGDQISWNVTMKGDGQGAPESRTMRMTARKTKAVCS